MKNLLKISTFLFVAFAISFIACNRNEVTPVPTIDFTFEVTGHDVVFTSTVTDVGSYAWNFGDGTSSAEANPTHTYVAGGDYEVICTVKGDGGEATATQTVSADYSDVELLSGIGMEGKTWKISSGDAGNTIEIIDTDQNGEMDTTDLPVQFLAIVQLFEEYTDEFTFKPDGTISIDNKGGKSFGAIATAMQVLELEDEVALEAAIASGIVKIPISPDTQNPTLEYGFCSFDNTTANGTWEFSSEEITVNGDYVTLQLSQTYTDENHIKFGEATSFFGFYNIINNQARIKSLSEDKLVVEFFVDSFVPIPNIGTLLLTVYTFELSFVPVSE